MSGLRSGLAVLTASLLLISVPGAQAQNAPPPALAQVMAEHPVDVGAPPANFGADSCNVNREAVLLGSQYLTLVVNFSFRFNTFNCNLGDMVAGTTLETPAGSHRFLQAMAADGRVMGISAAGLTPGKHYLVYERRNAVAADAQRAVFNGLGRRVVEGARPERRSLHSESAALLNAVFRDQDQRRSEVLISETAKFEAQGGPAAYLAQLNGSFPDLPLLGRLFGKAVPLPDNACSQGIYKTLAKLMAQSETLAVQFSSNLTGANSEMRAYTTPAGLAQANKTPHLDYEAFTPPDSNGTARLSGLALLPSADCQQVNLKAEYVGAYTNKRKYGQIAFAEIRADFGADFVQGSISHRYHRYFTNSDLSPGNGALTAVNFLCAAERCYAGSVDSVFKQGALKSTDAWQADIKAGIAALEVQRDRQLAQQKRDRDAREAKEAAEQRQAQAEATRRQQADERALNGALGAKDPQAMYLAAGKYERDGEPYKARQVYEKLIARFASSPWAVKANDQLLQNQRVDAVNSNTQRANSAAGERAVAACRIEVNACYGRSGKDCYRNCEALR